jgi:hypothetical protein
MIIVYAIFNISTNRKGKTTMPKHTKEMQAKEWEHVGVVGVDSGQILIADPCYWIGDDTSEADYKKICEALGYGATAILPYEDGFTKGRPGKGIAVHSGHGDGVYPVYVRRDPQGAVEECKIVFLEND